MHPRDILNMFCFYFAFKYAYTTSPKNRFKKMKCLKGLYGLLSATLMSEAKSWDKKTPCSLLRTFMPWKLWKGTDRETEGSVEHVSASPSFRSPRGCTLQELPNGKEGGDCSRQALLMEVPLGCLHTLPMHNCPHEADGSLGKLICSVSN